MPFSFQDETEGHRDSPYPRLAVMQWLIPEARCVALVDWPTRRPPNRIARESSLPHSSVTVFVFFVSLMLQQSSLFFAHRTLDVMSWSAMRHEPSPVRRGLLPLKGASSNVSTRQARRAFDIWHLLRQATFRAFTGVGVFGCVSILFILLSTFAST